MIRPDGTGLRVLAAAGDHAGSPSWSPDGKRLVYRTSAKGDTGLRIIDLASERVTKLTNGPYTDNFPAWAPGGDRITFVSDRNDDYEIYSIRPDGSRLKRLTRSPGNEGHLAWSPDGKWIAFASARAGFVDEALLHPYNGQPTGEIFVMRADGTNAKRLTENPFEDATPAWRPTADCRNMRPPVAPGNQSHGPTIITASSDKAINRFRRRYEMLFERLHPVVVAGACAGFRPQALLKVAEPSDRPPVTARCLRTAWGVCRLPGP